MSLGFSDTTNKRGIVQTAERMMFGESGYGQISGNTSRLQGFTNDANLALDRLLSIIFRSDGRWQFDDTNHTDSPTITTALVASQRDYSFTTDGTSNVILDIQRVFVANNDATTIYNEIFPVDVQSQPGTQTFTDGLNAEGVPYRYDKTGNSIVLDPIPSYSKAAGLKLYINRETTYFATSDTTKEPGIAGLFHSYLAIRPAYEYAVRNSLKNVNLLREEMNRMETDIEEYYGRRAKDERKVLSNRLIRHK